MLNQTRSWNSEVRSVYTLKKKPPQSEKMLSDRVPTMWNLVLAHDASGQRMEPHSGSSRSTPGLAAHSLHSANTSLCIILDSILLALNTNLSLLTLRMSVRITHMPSLKKTLDSEQVKQTFCSGVEASARAINRQRLLCRRLSSTREGNRPLFRQSNALRFLLPSFKRRSTSCEKPMMPDHPLFHPRCVTVTNMEIDDETRISLHQCTSACTATKNQSHKATSCCFNTKHGNVAAKGRIL